MSDVVVLAGGSPHAHDFDAVRDALVALVDAAGHRPCAVADPDTAVDRLADADALLIDGLWWRMLGDAYDGWRDEFGYSPSAATREGLRTFVASGGGLVAMHTASICFDDWDEWAAIVGGTWHWGRSSHPPAGPVVAELVGGARHPVVADVGATFTLDDEVYGDLDVGSDVEVLATARRTPDDADQPVVWTHRYGDGRVVYDTFGHDAHSIRQPDHARLVTQALAWTLGSDHPPAGPTDA